jgi:hypothetical protein
MSQFQGLTAFGSSRPGMIRAAVPVSSPSGGGSTAAVGNLVNSFQQQETASRESAEKRFQDLLKQFQKTEKRVLGKQKGARQALSTAGQTARTDTERGRQRGQAQATQNLISRGLGNTTIAQSAARGVDEDAQRSLERIAEGVGQQRSGLLTQQAGQLQSLGGLGIDTSLSRQDVGPDMNTFLQLIRQLSSLSV